MYTRSSLSNGVGTSDRRKLQFTKCRLYFRDDLPESSFKYQLLGLNLLRLLAQNKLSDFHTVSIIRPKTDDLSDYHFRTSERAIVIKITVTGRHFRCSRTTRTVIG